jgi:cytochrome oxidase Cu insertion factor (SCO1/SenC/PrrC family)
VSRSKPCAVLVALIVAVGIICPSPAQADGDPASDTLVTQSLFAPVDAGLSDAQRAELTGLLSASERSHFPVRVALIASAADLGAVSEFWRKPATYARFLGIELSLIYKGPLLVAMPSGLGLNWPGHSTASTAHLLDRIRVQPAGQGWLHTVRAAIRDLAASTGATSGGETTNSAKTGEGGGGPRVLIVALIAAVITFALVVLILRRQRRRRGSSSGGGVSSHELTAWLGWAVPTLVIVLAAAVIVHELRPGGHRRVLGAEYVPENRPSSFPAHKKRAPNFSLTDQNGRPVSIAAYRGRSVIVTFVDPLSPEAVPAPVRALNAAERAVPASLRPAILAVSVNVNGDARADLRHDIAKWHLLPQWRWAVGSPAQLAAAWKDYFTVVSTSTESVAGSTVRFITHSKMAYLVDGHGYERVLFGWPYTARAVEQTLESP